MPREEVLPMLLVSPDSPKQHVRSRPVSRAKQRVSVRFISHADLLCQGSDPVLVRKHALPGPGPRRSFPPFGKANALDKESRLSGFRSFSNHPACYSDAVAVRYPSVLAARYVSPELHASPHRTGQRDACSDRLLVFWYGVHFTSHSFIAGR